MGNYEPDFQIAGNQVNGNRTPDNVNLGRTIEVTTEATPDLGVSPGSGMSTFGTVGQVITLNAIDPSGTVYSEVSGWGGTYAKSGTTPTITEVDSWLGTKGAGDATYATISTWMGTAGGGSPIGLLAGDNITTSTTGDVITIAGVDPSGTIYSEVAGWQGTQSEAIYAEITDWGGTDNQLVYNEVSTWMGTSGGGSPIGLLAGEAITLGSAGDVVTISGVSPSGTIYNEISTWQGTDAKAAWMGTIPSITQVDSWLGTKGAGDATYAVISTWMGTTANNWGIEGDTYVAVSTSGDVVSLDSQGVFTEIDGWMGTAGGGSPIGLIEGTNTTLSTNGDVITISADSLAETAFVLYDGSDNTKEVTFNLSSMDTSTVSTIYTQNASGTIAYLSDIEDSSLGLLGTGGLAISTSGNVMTLAGNRVLLATATAGNSATIEFTDDVGISNFRRLYLTGEGVSNIVDETRLYMRASSNSGGTWWSGANQYISNVSYPLTTTYNVQSYSDTHGYITTNVGGYQMSIRESGANFEMCIFPKTIGTTAPGWHSLSTYRTGGIVAPNIEHCQIAPRADITGLQIYASSGNICYGVFHLYGEH